MEILRLGFLHLAAGVATLLAASNVVLAQTYPTRPVRLVVGFPPGGVVDIVARIVGQSLSERLGQPVVIENRGGAAGNVATETVARALPDGHTLLLSNVSNAINATLYERLSFDFLADFVSVAAIQTTPGVVVVNPSFQVRSIPELIAYAKANPGKTNMASGGNGSVNHVYGELFKMMAGVDMLHVPYRGGGPAIADLISGVVHVSFSPVPPSIEYIRAGKLRALAVTTAARVEVLPETPTVASFLPGYAASGWLGISAPRSTPANVVDRLNKEINAGLADPRVRARIMDLGGTVLPGSPTDFAKFIAEDTDKWAKVVKFSGARPD
jgi:tripartite-type tricarboxylate transporter receptor subunit TctC